MDVIFDTNTCSDHGSSCVTYIHELTCAFLCMCVCASGEIFHDTYSCLRLY